MGRIHLRGRRLSHLPEESAANIYHGKHAGAPLSHPYGQALSTGDIRSDISGGIQPVTPGQEKRPVVVKLLRDKNHFAGSVNIPRAPNGVERAPAGGIKHNDGGGHPPGHQGVAHRHGFIVKGIAPGAGYDDPANLPAVKEFSTGLHPRKKIGACGAGAEDEPPLLRCQGIDLRENAATGGQDHPYIDGDHTSQSSEDAKNENPGTQAPKPIDRPHEMTD